MYSRSILLVLIGLLLTPMIQAQGRFTVNGRLKVEGSDLSGARAVVFKNGEKERSITTGLNKFSLDLDLNANYVISFEKDGFVAKKISFNTKAPAEAIANGFTPFDFAVSLFKQYDDINIVVFNQPVGMIRYDDKTGDFDYDTDYTKSIQSQLQQVLAQVEHKQKEEAIHDKEMEAKAVEEARAKAKADAEAVKMAAAKAKAEAEAQKLAQQQAKATEKQQAAIASKTDPPPPLARKEQAAVPVEGPKRKIEPASPSVVEPRAERDPLSSMAVTGEDGRRVNDPVVRVEASPVAVAKAVLKQEERKEPIEEQPELLRQEELLVEPTRVTTLIRVTKGARTDEYRKVIHKWGGTYYFKNGATCTHEVYDTEAQGEQLAGTTPRGKMD